MKKNNNSKYFWYPFTSLFIIYIALSIALESGYYETVVGEKVTFTEEQIKKFEEDVEAGKAVDMEDYLDIDHDDYSTNMSKLGSELSQGVEGVMTKGISKMFELIAVLVS